jgi:hypothetical protein
VTRESVQAKAARYLAEARLTITFVDGDRVLGHCRGDGELYEVGHDPGQGWTCTCPARTDQCCHLIALRRVTIRPAGLGRVPVQIPAQAHRSETYGR